MNDIRRPREGMTTIGIAFTKSVLRKISDGVQQLEKEGWSEQAILKKMAEEMPSYTAHTLQRMYDIAMGRKITSDFKDSEVKSRKAVAQDTFELELAQARPELHTGSIVHFLGADWYVKAVSGTTYVIRRIL